MAKPVPALSGVARWRLQAIDFSMEGRRRREGGRYGGRVFRVLCQPCVELCHGLPKLTSDYARRPLQLR